MPVTTEKGSHAVPRLHLSLAAVTPHDDGGCRLTFLSFALKNILLDKDQENQILNSTTGHLRHKLGKHQAVRPVKAVHAHNRHDAMHQYVMTNLSLRDTIRRRQEQPVVGRKESRLTAEERQSGIKDQLCQKRRGHRSVISPEPSLHAFHFQVSIGHRQGAKLPKEGQLKTASPVLFYPRLRVEIRAGGFEHKPSQMHHLNRKSSKWRHGGKNHHLALKRQCRISL